MRLFFEYNGFCEKEIDGTAVLAVVFWGFGNRGALDGAGIVFRIEKCFWMEQGDVVSAWCDLITLPKGNGVVLAKGDIAAVF